MHFDQFGPSIAMCIGQMFKPKDPLRVVRMGCTGVDRLCARVQMLILCEWAHDKDGIQIYLCKIWN